MLDNTLEHYWNKHPLALPQEGAYFSNVLLMGCYCTQNALPFAKNKFFWMRCNPDTIEILCHCFTILKLPIRYQENLEK